jgi:hypothetical protein
MKQAIIMACFILLQKLAFAQTDTIKPTKQNLRTEKLFSSAANFVVYWEDEHGNVTGQIDLWKRELQIKGKQFLFNWKWYRNDSLYANISTTGNSVTMEPSLHHVDYFKKGKITFLIHHDTVTIPEGLRTNAQLRSFKVKLDPPAFAFPMDLEILALLPFKKLGQQFAIPFYEPGSKRSAFYQATVISKDQLSLPGSKSISCWVLRLNYAQDAYADFWIADKKRQVIKMRERYQGKYRYKVKLY